MLKKFNIKCLQKACFERFKNAFCDKIDDEYKTLKESLVSEIGLYLTGG
jgi:hypothetical protein